MENQQIALPEDIDDTIRILQLVTGRVDGQAFWAYMAMKPSNHAEYADKVAAGEPIDLLEYGEVLEQGWGAEPPEEIKEKMAKDYGAQTDFEEQFKAAMEKAQEMGR